MFSMTQKKFLHRPHRSRHVPEEAWGDYPGAILNNWHALADQKGFRVDRRVRDRLHLALECKICGAHTAHKLHTLRTAQPTCLGCQGQSREGKANLVGLELLDRDNDNHQYNLYRLPCGHESLLQNSRVDKLLKHGTVDGRSGFHCPTCYTQQLQSMASDFGWRLVGPDPKRNANYRLLAHKKCGHQQRVATANLVTERFNCGGCGDSWSAAPSALYLMRFRVPEQGRFVKLGYSRNPKSRLRYQLGLAQGVEAELIDVVDMPTGQVALQIEKGLHRELAADHADKVISPEVLKGWINVTSEIYAAELEPVIRRMFEGLEKPKARKPN
jgi:hypothetical protein